MQFCRRQQKMLDQLLMSIEGSELWIGVGHSSYPNATMSAEGSALRNVRPPEQREAGWGVLYQKRVASET